MTTLQPVRLVLDCPELTPRQQQVIGFIAAYTTECQYPPTLREVQESFGFRSPNGAQSHIDALRKKGFLRENATYHQARCLLINTERLRWREVT